MSASGNKWDPPSFRGGSKVKNAHQGFQDSECTIQRQWWGEVSLLGALEDSTAPNAVSRSQYTRSCDRSQISATDTIATALFLQSFAAWRKDANNLRHIV